MDWGACYFDHLERLFRSPAARQVFTQAADQPTIQILAYDKVFAGCRVFASVGLSHYSEEVGQIAEVYVPVDAGWTQAPAVLANALFYMVQHEMRMGWGLVVGGIHAIDPAFVRQFKKEALYLANPVGLPTAAGTVHCGGERGALYLGIFLSEAESAFFVEHGAERLEHVLQDKNVDPYDLSRPSAV